MSGVAVAEFAALAAGIALVLTVITLVLLFVFTGTGSLIGRLVRKLNGKPTPPPASSRSRGRQSARSTRR